MERRFDLVQLTGGLHFKFFQAKYGNIKEVLMSEKFFFMIKCSCSLHPEYGDIYLAKELVATKTTKPRNP